MSAPARTEAPAVAAAGVKRRLRRPARWWGGVLLRYALLVLVLVITVGPFLWQLSTSLKGSAENVFAFPPRLLPEDPTLGNYAQVAQAIPLARYALNSTVVSVAQMAGNCLFGAMAGYALARMSFRGRDLLFALLISTLIVPFEVIMISTFLVTRELGLTNTLLGVVLPNAVTVLSIFIMRQGFLAVPREIEEAAVIDGANEWQLFWRVALPSVRNQLAVVAIFSFMFAWDDFLWPLIVLRDPAKYTLTLGIEYLSGAFSADQRLIAAGTIVAFVPLLILFALLQRWFFRGIQSGGIKG